MDDVHAVHGAADTDASLEVGLRQRLGDDEMHLLIDSEGPLIRDRDGPTVVEGRLKQGADATGRRGESIGGQQGFQGPSVKAERAPVGDNRSPHPIVRAKGRRRRGVE